MKFAFVREHRRVWPVKVICHVLGVARSGFYAWLKRGVSARRRRRAELVAQIRAVHEENRRVYGSPRVCRALQAGGVSVCANTVARCMRQAGLRARVKGRFVPRTTDSAHAQPLAENLLARSFHPGAVNQKWVADITYVPTDEGWLYVAGVLDLGSRKIIGWSMADHLRAELVGDALAMALARRAPLPLPLPLPGAGAPPEGEQGLLHHSDRGVQYACADYQALLKARGITPSMSGKGDCHDNAVMESFWATLKTELVHQRRYATRAEARASIFEYIEVFYNRKRLHSSLGYLSPEAFEAGLN